MKDSDKAITRRVNNEFRRKDMSRKWPINGKFNATERAIRQLKTKRPEPMTEENYTQALEQAISAIVNDERNW